MYRCAVVGIVDGDTFDADIELGLDMTIRDKRIRLYGINTPETRTRDAEEKARGRAATEFTRSRLYEASSVILEAKGCDSFGRWLCKVYYTTDSGTRLLNSELVDAGHAVYYQVNLGG